MTVENLIQKLQAIPWHYEVLAFVPGVEVDDFDAPVVDVVEDYSSKTALLEFTPKAGKPKQVLKTK